MSPSYLLSGIFLPLLQTALANSDFSFCPPNPGKLPKPSDDFSTSLHLPPSTLWLLSLSSSAKLGKFSQQNGGIAVYTSPPWASFFWDTDLTNPSYTGIFTLPLSSLCVSVCVWFGFVATVSEMCYSVIAWSRRILIYILFQTSFHMKIQVFSLEKITSDGNMETSLFFDSACILQDTQSSPLYCLPTL